MDPRAALQTLIETADLLPEQKEGLLSMLPTMTDESVMELGKMLSLSRQEQVRAAKNAVAAIDDALAQEQP